MKNIHPYTSDLDFYKLPWEHKVGHVIPLLPTQ